VGRHEPQGDDRLRRFNKDSEKSVRFHPLAFSLCAILIASVAQSQQWTGKAELGVLMASGNTEAKSANTKFDLKRESEKWINTFFVGALYGENAEFSTAERYEAKYQLDFRINDRLSWFGALRGEQDRFSGFVYQLTASTGASYKFIDTPETQLQASFGAGHRRLKSETLIKTDAGEVIGRIEGEIEDDPVLTLSSDYAHNFTENTKITNKLLVESGSDNTAVQNDLALAVSMTDALALAVGFGVRYNTDPPPLSDDTDLLTTINLVYNIQ
jgi:putative salt-induced outer membrane protein